MKYLLVAEIAKKWNMSERSVRNYCAQGRVKGACHTDDRTFHLGRRIEYMFVYGEQVFYFVPGFVVNQFIGRISGNNKLLCF